eukprot:TRINITY_DN63785_c0_g1_i1.p1 TRINITY_DN63785_c0_g1~~TRINITY_DN63785_c0_g1_i1.p1  ORF type:complete len:445 (-),score=91.61 TRINITY_DN63785_c0_g1_i1:50-1303(-)
MKAIMFFSIGANSSLFRFIAVFYTQIGLDNSQIGFLQTAHPWTVFAGSFAWAALCDTRGEYKGILVFSNFMGAVIMCCLLLHQVQEHFLAVCACVILGSAMLSSRAGLIDALTLQVVQDYEAAEKERPQELAQARKPPNYGEQRLWGSAGYGLFALMSGTLMDRFGDSAMFATAMLCLAVTVGVVSTQLPGDLRRREKKNDGGGDKGSFLRFDVLWFFMNLFVYGWHMALVEAFLFVYLVTDFVPVDKQLLGLAVCIQCLFQLPVFFYIQRLIDNFSLRSLLSACHVIFAVRLFAYSILPFNHPWSVLFVEPFHGITMAAMWSCSVEFGRRVAPKGAEARMQALIGGIFYRLSQGAGSLAWGFATRPPLLGFGFRNMYRLAAVNIICWCFVWNLGWAMSVRRPRRDLSETLTAPLRR